MIRDPVAVFDPLPRDFCNHQKSAYFPARIDPISTEMSANDLQRPGSQLLPSAVPVEKLLLGKHVEIPSRQNALTILLSRDTFPITKSDVIFVGREFFNTHSRGVH
jgi:hypothetical protein